MCTWSGDLLAHGSSDHWFRNSRPDLNRRALETCDFLDCLGIGLPNPWYLCMYININIFCKHNHFYLLCYCSVGPLKCFISLVNKNFFFSIFTFRSPKLHTIPCFLAGSFAIRDRDHLSSGNHLPSNLGIICGLGRLSQSPSSTCGFLMMCTTQIKWLPRETSAVFSGYTSSEAFHWFSQFAKKSVISIKMYYTRKFVCFGFTGWKIDGTN